MISANELIACPGGCGNSVHRNAPACPHCGYQAELGRLEEPLGSLSTVSSILTGFGLAALVQLASTESSAREDLALQSVLPHARPPACNPVARGGDDDVPKRRLARHGGGQ
jgi:hypothetical protein